MQDIWFCQNDYFLLAYLSMKMSKQLLGGNEAVYSNFSVIF